MTSGAAEFTLPEGMKSAIIDHARREHPRECCGVIIGKGAHPNRILEMKNVAEGNRFYEIDPTQLIELEFEILPAEDLELLAIYHSHPESVAFPSATDIELAFWSEAVYLICSLEMSQHPYVRGFRIRDGSVDEVTLLS